MCMHYVIYFAAMNHTALKIGNFNIEQQNGQTIISYRRSFKDWFDILLFLAIGAGACAFIVIMYRYTHFKSWVYWVVAGFFCIFCLY